MKPRPNMHAAPVPAHANGQLWEIERMLCRQLGCRPVEDDRGAPVTMFFVCLRCGKFSRDLGQFCPPPTAQVAGRSEM